MSDLISVIVPVYNVEKYLDRCVQSLINQTYKNLEIILVDDGSPDNCPAMCDEYAKKDSRIKVIHKKNGGLGFARNSGLDIATGKYFAFIDSDDYVDLDYYETLYKAVSSGDYDVALCGMSSEFNGIKKHGRHIFSGNTFDQGGVMNILLPSMLGADKYGKNDSGISACKAIYKLSLVKDNNIRFVSEREYISEDAVFDIELYRYVKSAIVTDGCGYYYCYNGSSLSHSYKPDRFEQIKKLCDYELGLVKDYPSGVICAERIINTFLGNVRVVMKHEAAHFCETKNLSDLLKIKSLVKDSYLQKIIREYDYSNLPAKQKISCICIRHKLWLTSFVFAQLQNKSKGKL